MQALIIPLDQVVEENANVPFFEKTKTREVFFGLKSRVKLAISDRHED